MPAVLALMATSGASRALAQGYASEIALGRALFRDKNLSSDRTVACISCHQPDHAFADHRPVSFGVHHRPGTRNAPSLLNIGAYRTFFWDGHAPSLRAQVAFPFLAANELGFVRKEEVVARVERNPAYVAAFRRLRCGPGVPLRFADIARALVAYERSLRTRPSPFDRYLAGDRTALSLSARRGLKLFRGKAGCASCHVIRAHSAPLTDNEFHSEGVGLSAIGPKVAMLAREAAHRTVAERFLRVESDAPLASLGRYLVTLNPKDIGKFRTPSLKNVALTAPYMHDGSVPTLAQAVDIELYYRGLKLGTPIILSTEDQRDLLAFLRSLSALPRKEHASANVRIFREARAGRRKG